MEVVEFLGIDIQRRKIMEINKILNGDCLQHLKELPDECVDAIITDPPYGISFMNKKWDYSIPSVEVWKECLRVLKSGGHLLSFSGTRTYHRMAVAIEDAGFEIRDTIMWLYGSGFPKSSICALKPACEPIVLARKPIKESSVIKNIEKYGVGGLNIEDCRIEHNEELKITQRGERQSETWKEGSGFKNEVNNLASPNPKGRFPANIILDEESAVMLDEQSGISKSVKSKRGGNVNTGGGRYQWQEGKNEKFIKEDAYECGFNDIGGASRFFYVAKANKKERDLGCDAIDEKPMRYEDNSSKSLEIFSNQYTESSGNPTGRGQTTPRRNNHPTVKPIKLMEYLVKLVTKEGHVVLDPFLGSGTTAIACINLKREWLGIEREPEYIKIAQARINYFSEQKRLSV